MRHERDNLLCLCERCAIWRNTFNAAVIGLLACPEGRTNAEKVVKAATEVANEAHGERREWLY